MEARYPHSIVCLSVARLHRLHLSTGEHHSLAMSRGALKLRRYDAIILRNSWEIRGDYVKISINHEPIVTDIWNWKTGTWEAEVVRTIF